MSVSLPPIPRPEHPKPQMRRDAWENLNGPWEFETDLSNTGVEREFWKRDSFSGRILVPFCPESPLSGIGGKDFMPAVWYRRTVYIDESRMAGRVFLHFGAVDYWARVWVNGREAGRHKGGYSSFSFDITELARAGENSVVVYAFDDNRRGVQPSGKQSERYHSYGCLYTRTTGIWQTVWLEYTPKAYIKSTRILPDAANGRFTVEACLGGETGGALLRVKASLGGEEAARGEVKAVGHNAYITLPLSPVVLWDAGQPNLYDLELTLEKDGAADNVHSYFGLRSVEWKNHALYLNGRPLFQRLILDQGFYPDGIYTAPTDEALVNDIKLSMELGFNGARLHEKVFEERFLYHADRLGYLVWGEHANWGLNIENPAGLMHFLPEWMEVLERDFNHPAIVGWCPFNESWDGMFGKNDMGVLQNVYRATKLYDKTRPVIDTSGYHHIETDVYDTHDYRQDADVFEKCYAALKPGEIHETHPGRQQYMGQPFFVSEYGGAWWKPEDNGGDSWGYSRPGSEEAVCALYERLTTALLRSPAVCAFCYTQLYDVEQECNGLYTYARGKKFSEETYARITSANRQTAAVEELML